jgi:hypothetical protein
VRWELGVSEHPLFKVAKADFGSRLL